MNLPIITMICQPWHGLLILLLCLTPLSATSAQEPASSTPQELPPTSQIFDFDTVKDLEGEAMVGYFKKLDLHGDNAMLFWKELPISKANKQIYRLFQKQMFSFFLQRHPSRLKSLKAFQLGKGVVINGSLSAQKLTLPYTYILPLPEGPIGDSSKHYRIGLSVHGFKSHPWLQGFAESALWEASRHSNLEIVALDPNFDDNKQSDHIRGWAEQGFDGILVWPRVEGPAVAEIEKAVKKGVYVVSADRLTGAANISNRIVGDLPSNGTQQGIFLVDKLMQTQGKVKGNIVLIRKPKGSADTYRTGQFLKIASYFPDLKIVANYHNNSNRNDSKRQMEEALKKLAPIDIVFCTGAEQSMGVIDALNEANAWYSGEGGRKTILLSNDDSRAAMQAIKSGKQEMLAPYTPLLADVGIRALIHQINGNHSLPKDIIVPYVQMVTPKRKVILGIQTLSVDDWLPYAYGPVEIQKAIGDNPK